MSSTGQRYDARVRREAIQAALPEPTSRQLRKWGSRATTIHLKACELYREISEALGEDHDLTSRIAGIMCDAAAFARIDPRYD